MKFCHFDLRKTHSNNLVYKKSKQTKYKTQRSSVYYHFRQERQQVLRVELGNIQHLYQNNESNNLSIFKIIADYFSVDRLINSSVL